MSSKANTMDLRETLPALCLVVVSIQKLCKVARSKNKNKNPDLIRLSLDLDWSDILA